ncbi:MAG: aminotransferase class I/II-fold pyridoxal phosphate-dependent enzyme [Candidatus Latescibacteria bacterium]|jgi:alanine-synthesizing transaminase|nr:aminotransferase class I/II-fold pyridoxal phosphate-dependent enzyme [Candidatus Latescibacterota bacterium]
MTVQRRRTARLEKLPPYLFARLNSLKLKMRQEGIDIIDFGMGNPNIPAPENVVSKIRDVVLDPKTHRYSASRGIPNLRKAICRQYSELYDVDLDWESESTALLGSKEGLAHLMLALLDPGDSVLVPNPTFPVHIYSVGIAGGNVIAIPLREKTGFIPALEDITREIWPKPKVLLLSFPHNPTTACVDLDFWGEVVDFAKRSNVTLVNDFAYARMGFDGYTPPSMLQIPGAKDIAVEFTTMSKVYGMAGWRVGFCVGNKDVIEDLYSIKGYFDYGIFTPVQVAAINALDGQQDYVHKTVEIYRNRRDVFVDGLAKIGWEVPRPKATMYLWCPIPEKYRSMGSIEFSMKLLRECEVVVSPGAAFGEFGEGYVRIALVENEQRINQAIRNIKKHLF